MVYCKYPNLVYFKEGNSMENQEMQVQQPVKKTSGLGVAALVLGIIAIVFSLIPIIRVVAYVLAPLAFIFGLISLIKKKSVGVAVVGVILAIAAIVLTVVFQAATIAAVDKAVDELDSAMSDLSGDNTEDILANYADVTLGEFTVTKGDFMDECKLPVTVKNKGDEKKSFSIQVEAVDKDGNRIDDDYVYANDLNAGQSQTFDIFTLVTSDDMETLKNATFRIVEISMF